MGTRVAELLRLVVSIGLLEMVVVHAAADASRRAMGLLCRRGRGRGDGFFDEVRPFVSALAVLAVRYTAYSMIAARFLGINLGSVMQSVSLVGAAVMMMLQKVVREAVAGTSLVWQRPFGVGDRITLRVQGQEFMGTVRSFSLHHVKLACAREGGQQQLVLVPNSAVLDAIVRVLAPDVGRELEWVRTAASTAAVVVFGKSYCPATARVKRALLATGASHTVYDLDQIRWPQEGPVQQALREVTGELAVPQVFIGGEFVPDTPLLHEHGQLTDLLLRRGATFDGCVTSVSDASQGHSPLGTGHSGSSSCSAAPLPPPAESQSPGRPGQVTRMLSGSLKMFP